LGIFILPLIIYNIVLL